MSSYQVYQNSLEFIKFYNSKMLVASTNGYQLLQDLLQDMYEKVSINPELLQGRKSGNYWARLLSNRVKDYYKSYAVKFSQDDDCLADLPYELHFDGDDTLLIKGLSELTLRQGQVLTYYLEGLKLSEIALKLGISKPAISKLWKKIETRLKESDSFCDNFGAELGGTGISSSENYYNYCLDNEEELKQKYAV